MKFNISAEEVKRLREERGMSLFEARDILIKKQLLSAVDSATNIEDLKEIIRYIIERGKGN